MHLVLGRAGHVPAGGLGAALARAAATFCAFAGASGPTTAGASSSPFRLRSGGVNRPANADTLLFGAISAVFTAGLE